MDGIFDLAVKMFFFIMIVTSWRELIRIGTKILAVISGFITGALDYAVKRMKKS